MKCSKQLAYYSSVTILCVTAAGCGLPRRAVQPLANGYREVTHESGYIHVAHRIELQHRDLLGATSTVWPSLRSRVMIDGDTAMFIGHRATWQPDSDKNLATKPRLFAVRPPGPALDITSEVLYRWSRESGRDSQKALKTAQIVTLLQKDGAVEVGIVFCINENWPEADIRLEPVMHFL